MSNHLENILALTPNIMQLIQHPAVLDLMETTSVDCFISEVVASANSELERLLDEEVLTDSEIELIELCMEEPAVLKWWRPETIMKFKNKVGMYVPDEDEEEYGRSEQDDWRDEDFNERMRSFR